eukprot:15025_1
MSFGLRCVDDAFLIPTWIVCLGIIIQITLNTMIYGINNAQYKSNQLCCAMFSVFSQDKSCQRRMIDCIRILYAVYQIIKMISIFVLDAIQMKQQMHYMQSGWNKYNCFAEILLYSSNAKSLCINSGIIDQIVNSIMNIVTVEDLNERDDQVEAYSNTAMRSISFIIGLLYIPLSITHFIPWAAVYCWIALPIGILPIVLQKIMQHCDQRNEGLKAGLYNRSEIEMTAYENPEEGNINEYNLKQISPFTKVIAMMVLVCGGIFGVLMIVKFYNTGNYIKSLAEVFVERDSYDSSWRLISFLL